MVLGVPGLNSVQAGRQSRGTDLDHKLDTVYQFTGYGPNTPLVCRNPTQHGANLSSWESFRRFSA